MKLQRGVRGLKAPEMFHEDATRLTLDKPKGTLGQRLVYTYHGIKSRYGAILTPPCLFPSVNDEGCVINDKSNGSDSANRYG
jgi:hypothetical protein